MMGELTPETLSQYRKSAALWRMEERLMESCITLGNQLITQLQSSGGDQWEDIEVLEGLIETWDMLRLSANEAAMNDEYKVQGRS